MKCFLTPPDVQMVGVPTIYTPVPDDDGNIKDIRVDRTPLNRFQKDNGSESALQWLYYTSAKLGRELRTTRSVDGEAQIGPELRAVDGYDPLTGQCYEFLGCKYHFW